MNQISMEVNGRSVSAGIDPRTLLVEFLRENLDLVGARIGCDTSHCGACTVQVDGQAIKACTMLAVECDGANVVTVEGLSSDGSHPMQKAFQDHHGLQCGFCTPGMIMTGIDIADRRGQPDREMIRTELKGNICRCTGYHNIVSAIEAGARDIASSARENAGGDDA